MFRRVLAVVAACLLTAPVAQAADFNGFHSVLAFGQGKSTSAADLAAFEAGGTAPAADLSQRDAYEGLEQAGPTFTLADLDRYYKDSSFGVLPGGAASTETPKAGVTIVRDAKFSVPRITGKTRSDVMWGAGYASAEDRLFFMDVLRHTAEGTMTSLLGSSYEAADSKQLGLENRSPTELTDQIESLPQTSGAEGSQVLQDIQDYVDGINAFITETKMNPTKMPAEYPALGIVPA